MEVRKHFHKRNMQTVTKGCLSTVRRHVSVDLDVVYYWSICARELEETERAELLKLIIDTLRTLQLEAFLSLGLLWNNTNNNRRKVFKNPWV